MKIRLYVIIFILANFRLLISYESGWIDYGCYKSEKLTFPNLYRIRASEDNKSFFTFHADNIIRKWNLASGVLLDSIVFDRTPDLFFFSNDGKTAIISYYLDKIYYHEINIIDLETKEIISKSNIYIFNLFCLNQVQDEYVNNSNFIFDYSHIKNKLYIGTYSDISGTYGGGSVFFSHDGFLGILDVYKDTLIPSTQFICAGIKYFIFSDDNLYLSYDSDDHVITPHNPETFFTKYGLTKYSLSENKVYNLLNYQTNYLVSSNLKISDLYLFNNSHILLYKSDNYFQYFDLDSNRIIPNYFILSQSDAHCHFPDKNLLVTLENNILFLYPLYSTICSFIKLPISTNRILSIGNNILAYDYYLGQIILLNLDKNTSIIDNSQSSEFFIFPNPAKDYIEIRQSSGLFDTMEDYKINIFNTFGECVKATSSLTTTSSYQINIENFPAGIYYINIGRQTKMFVKI